MVFQNSVGSGLAGQRKHYNKHQNQVLHLICILKNLNKPKFRKGFQLRINKIKNMNHSLLYIWHLKANRKLILLTEKQRSNQSYSQSKANLQLILLMEQQRQTQSYSQSNRIQDRSKLQKVYSVQTIQSYNQIVKDLMAQSCSIGSKRNTDIAYQTNHSFVEFGCQTELQQINFQELQIEAISKEISISNDLQGSLKNQTISYKISESNISIDERFEGQTHKYHFQRHTNQLERNHRLKDISFESEKEEKDQAREKYFYEFDHEELNQMHQRYTTSQNQSDQSSSVVKKNIQTSSKLQKQLLQLKNKNKELNHQLFIFSEHFKQFSERQSLLTKSSIQLETANSTLSSRLAQVLQENKELVNFIQQQKKKKLDCQNKYQSSSKQIANLQTQINLYQNVISGKEEEISQLQKQLKAVKEEHFELNLINTQFEQLLKAKSQQLQEKIQQLEKQKLSHAETNNFYKQRLQSEGFMLNVQELNYIQEFIESQRAEESQKIKSVENHFKKQLFSFEKQKEKFMQRIQKLKQQRSFQNLTQSKPIQLKIQEVVNLQDRRLTSRDDQIIALKKQPKKQIQFHRQICYNNCTQYINQLNYLRDETMSKYGSLYQFDAQFAQILHRVLKLHSFTQKKNPQLNSQKKQVTYEVYQTLNSYQDIDSQKINFQQSQVQIRKLANHGDAETLKKQQKLNDSQTKSFKMGKNSSQSLGTLQSSNQTTNSSKTNPDSQKAEKQKQGQPFLKFKKIASRKNYTYQQKLQIVYLIIKAMQSRIKNNKKIESLFISQIYVKEIGQDFEIQLLKKSQKQEDSGNRKQMLYFAPQVLLGFAESQQSYVWTLGLLMDELFQGSLFYKKVNDVKSRTDNYYCRNPELKLKFLLQAMLKKNNKSRTSFSQVKKLILNEVTHLQYRI